MLVFTVLRRQYSFIRSICRKGLRRIYGKGDALYSAISRLLVDQNCNPKELPHGCCMPYIKEFRLNIWLWLPSTIKCNCWTFQTSPTFSH